MRMVALSYCWNSEERDRGGGEPSYNEDIARLGETEYHSTLSKADYIKSRVFFLRAVNSIASARVRAEGRGGRRRRVSCSLSGSGAERCQSILMTLPLPAARSYTNKMPCPMLNIIVHTFVPNSLSLDI
jgi:hypothetical protein